MTDPVTLTCCVMGEMKLAVPYVIAAVLIAQFATNLARDLGAFGTPGGDFLDFTPGDTQDAADLELQDAERRQGIRRSILAGGDQEPFLPQLGTPTILGAGANGESGGEGLSVLGE